ncbi:MAG: hypothetical protein HY460_02105 [Parcubacteria group bacterium]|nr:hypothetical protein [Parcubacteria group bacterium]
MKPLTEGGRMGSLTDELFKRGLLGKEQRDQLTTLREQQQRTAESRNFSQLSKKTGRPVHEDRLATCDSIAEFKDVARKLLTEDPKSIEMIINRAHRFKGTPGGDRLIWLMYQVRDGLRTTPPTQRERLLRRALRRSGSTLEPPR